MNTIQKVQPACEVIPLLEQEWLAEAATPRGKNNTRTTKKFLEFIEYHGAQNQSIAACMYRCALVQLRVGQSTAVLDGLGMTDEQMKRAVGA